MNIQKSHRYVQSIFLSALVAHEDDKYISKKIDELYPEKIDLQIVRERQITLLLLDTTSEKIIVHNGTQSLKDWMNNFKANVNTYFHDGISDEYFCVASKYVIGFTRGCFKPIKTYGHSQGGLASAFSVFDIISKLGIGIDVESIGYCSPLGFTSKGIALMKKNKCRVTSLTMHGDIVSRIGGIVFTKKWPFVRWARDYGYKHKLPKVEQDVIMGHAWSHVMRSLKRQFEIWNMPEQITYITAIEDVCKK